MRRTVRYIHDQKDWPRLTWNAERLIHLLAAVRFEQATLLGNLEDMGFEQRADADVHNITTEIVKSNEIEGNILDNEQVRSSVARQLGLETAALLPVDRNVDGIVAMQLDATKNFDRPLTKKRLFGWHAALFPTGYSGNHKITVGNWRKNDRGPMQVVSGAIGKEKVHFEAPHADRLKTEMDLFLKWFETEKTIDPVLKAGIAHFWFVTIHPFDDGNGRIARAIADMQMAKADKSPLRFYSMSAQIRKERKAYYEILEQSQKGATDITNWMEWFLQTLQKAIHTAAGILDTKKQKAIFWKKNEDALLNERQKKMLNKLLDGFEGKLTTSKWAKINKCSADTALRDIQQLLNYGMLVKDGAGGRSTGYLLNL
jgi:Fic family protein